MSDEAGEQPAEAHSEPNTREPDELPAEIIEAVPEWEDEYLDRVSDRLMYNYDLEKDYHLRGEHWALYGQMRVRNQKQFFHPALHYADHEAEEYLFARRDTRPTVADLDRLVALGHDLADERIDANEQHYGTDITFVLVVDEILPAVREHIDGFRDRTLLTFGYYGHYDVNLVVVNPKTEDCVASEAADVAAAFRLWGEIVQPAEGILSRFAKRFWR